MASKRMVEMRMDESILKYFRHWDCYVIWSDNNEKLQSISAYYNRVNHFVAMKPSWSTNILGPELYGRIWKDYATQPTPRRLELLPTRRRMLRTRGTVLSSR